MDEDVHGMAEFCYNFKQKLATYSRMILGWRGGFEALVIHPVLLSEALDDRMMLGWQPLLRFILRSIPYLGRLAFCGGLDLRYLPTIVGIHI